MFPCEIVERPAQHTVSVRFHSPVEELPVHFGRIYGAIMGYLQSQGRYPSGMPFAAYYNMDSSAFDVEAGFPVAEPLAGQGEIQPGEICGGTSVVCHHTGPYSTLHEAYDGVARFMAEHHLAPSGPAYEYYFTGPETPPEQTRTDIVFPVVPAPETAAP